MAFKGYLKQSTAATIVLGPFVDSADGDTAETSLTIAQADVRLSKNGGAFAQVGESTSASHMEAGLYSKPLNTTDTGTLGILTIAVKPTGALRVRQEYAVLPANIYDSWFSTDLQQVDLTQIGGAAVSTSTAQLGVNAVQISASATAADNVESAFASTLAEESAVPAANAPIWTKLNFLFLKARNKITGTATTQTVFADDGSTTVSTSTVSDDGTTYTRGEFS